MEEVKVIKAIVYIVMSVVFIWAAITMYRGKLDIRTREYFLMSEEDQVNYKKKISISMGTLFLFIGLYPLLDLTLHSLGINFRIYSISIIIGIYAIITGVVVLLYRQFKKR